MNWIVSIILIPLLSLAFSCKRKQITAESSVKADYTAAGNAVNDIDWSHLEGDASLTTLIEKKELLEELTKVTNAFAAGLKFDERCEVKNVKISRTGNDVVGKELVLTLFGRGDLALCDPTQISGEGPVTDSVDVEFKVNITYQISMESWTLVAKVRDVRVEVDNQFADALLGFFRGMIGDLLEGYLNKALSKMSGLDLQGFLFSQLGVKSLPGHMTPSVEVYERGLLVKVAYSLADHEVDVDPSVDAARADGTYTEDSAENQILESKTGELWLDGTMISGFAQFQARQMFTKMNQDLIDGNVELTLQEEYGYANAGWQTPRIDIDSIIMGFEQNLLVTRLDLILPYRWQDYDQEREEEREFTVSITTKQTFEVKAGIPLLTQVDKKASDLKGGDPTHRQQLNIMSDVLQVIDINSAEEMEQNLEGYVDENTPAQGSLGFYDGRIVDNNLVYD